LPATRKTGRTLLDAQRVMPAKEGPAWERVLPNTVKINRIDDDSVFVLTVTAVRSQQESVLLSGRVHGNAHNLSTVVDAEGFLQKEP
jgi:hypothetical protein